MPRSIILIVHNVRSNHNVGSLLRTADGLGVETVWLTGYTPYPAAKNDKRLPHVARRADQQIAKTALGAEKSVNWHHSPDIFAVLDKLQGAGFTLAALEQAPGSTNLPDYQPSDKLALVIGREVEGIEVNVLKHCDLVLEIPMHGSKESFNVAQAAAMALYHCRFS